MLLSVRVLCVRVRGCVCVRVSVHALVVNKQRFGSNLILVCWCLETPLTHMLSPSHRTHSARRGSASPPRHTSSTATSLREPHSASAPSSSFRREPFSPLPESLIRRLYVMALEKPGLNIPRLAKVSATMEDLLQFGREMYVSVACACMRSCVCMIITSPYCLRGDGCLEVTE